MKEKKMITIGKITKNQGNKGEVRVIPLTDSPERFEFLEYVYLFRGDNILTKKIESIRFHKNFIILKFFSINDIDSALELKDFQVKIHKEDVLPLDENEYYIDDLIGFEVITIDGDSIGKISDIIITGGTDVFLVNGAKKEYMIPAALDLISEINESDERMVIDPIPGLLDL